MTPPARYTATARTFHGVMAVMMIGLLTVGLYMTDLEPTNPNKWPLYGLHKEFGITVLALVALRILWRATHMPPAPLLTHKKWEITLAHLIHTLLYLGMIVMPISGYVMSSAGGHDINIFGLFNLPLLIDKNEQIGGLARTIHGYAGYAIIAAITLHFAGAMKHAVIDRDHTLARMFGFIRIR